MFKVKYSTSYTRSEYMTIFETSVLFVLAQLLVTTELFMLWKMLFSEIWFHETLLQDDIDHQFQFSDWWNMYLVTFLMTPGHHNCNLELDFVRKLTWYILWPLIRKLHLLVDAIQEFFIQFLKTQSFRIPGKRTSAIGPWHTYQLWYNLIYLSLAYS